MMAIGAYVNIIKSLTEREFCKHHPHPVMLHEATDPLQPTEDTEGETIDRLFISRGPDGEPVLTRTYGPTGPGQLYTVYVLKPARSSTLSIGCSARCEIQINDQSLSKIHALFEAREGRFFLCDNGSTSGTRINDELLRTREWSEVASGDRISLGTVELTFLPAENFYRLVRRLFID
jgi:pSer/pThr/pTyr-binding forkhead associated (FHA) protein